MQRPQNWLHSAAAANDGHGLTEAHHVNGEVVQYTRPAGQTLI